MANLNKVMLIGRLTRDAEIRTFSSGGKVAMFGFAVNNRKKNQQTGQWEEVPVFVEVEAFNRGDFGKSADTFEQYFGPGKGKGRQIFIEGHLKFDQWDDKTTGQKRTKLSVVLDSFQFLDSKPDSGEGGGGYRASSAPASRPVDSGPTDNAYPDEPGSTVPPSSGHDEEIPF